MWATVSVTQYSVHTTEGCVIEFSQTESVIKVQWTYLYWVIVVLLIPTNILLWYRPTI